MEPDSIALVAAIFAGAAALLLTALRARRWFVRGVAGVIALALSTAGGIAVVNDYYGYYQTWGQMSSDLTGSYRSFATSTADRREVAVHGGRLDAVTFAGARSGITRHGFVYLPPQYFQPAFAHTRFPVIELLHGTPGRPSDWVVHLHVVRVLTQLMSEHLIGPMVVVMPQMSAGRQPQECLDEGSTLDGTYVADDVRHDVLAQFRVSTVPAEWGIAGYSSGAYCATNLALRDRGEFGAVASMDGYFRPSDGPAAGFLHDNRAAEDANDPLLAAQRLGRDVRPLPSFWLAAGTGDAGDFAAATAFARALHGVERVTLYREPGAGHNFYAWEPDLPRLFAWTWTQLAPPALRVDFPVSGPVEHSSLHVRIPPRHAHPTPSRRRSRPVAPATGRPASATDHAE